MADEGLIEGREAVQQALRAALLKAAEQGGRELCWLDADFSGWPLSDATVLEALHRWALPHRRLHLLAADYAPLRRHQPRFVQWRGLHDHVITAKAFEPAELQGHEPTPQGLLLAPGLLALRLWSDSRAWLHRDSATQLLAREWFDAVAQRSCESFAVSTLGL